MDCEYYISDIFYLTIMKDEDIHKVMVGSHNCKIKFQINIFNELNYGIIVQLYEKKYEIKKFFDIQIEIVELVKSVLCFLDNKYPHIIEYKISDRNYLKCIENKRILWSNYYYMRYKKIWIEDMYNIKLDDIHKIVKKKFHRPIELSKNEYYIKFRSCLSRSYHDILLDYYCEDISMYKLFHKIIKNNDNYMDYYMIFYSLLDNCLEKAEWKILASDIKNYNIINTINKIELETDKHQKINKYLLKHNNFKFKLKKINLNNIIKKI